ncbi:PRC-barrel domain-containing protein [Rhodomicrobium udaipurense]|jgi:hypothetical protein|uniref:PRC-barrel domain-containing protein n=1 Tax=Rhodomicrobium udaipurense TaxID=1202716 RepID=A0A8I1KLG5_9HYPH|nr:PRC-barrel domain-containing protein [Rhodomicrobium udaipurense]MBJ7543298.1 PRC-barrel domain-containing protein [Rhodomicrobium udaipurense]
MQTDRTDAITPGRKLISSDDVEGAYVYGAGDERIGTIEEIMIDCVGGRVAYAVVDFGGFLGIGRSERPIPWSALRYDEDLDAFRTSITKEQLENSPPLDDEAFASTDWESRTHEHYTVQPYWSNPSINR